MRIVGGLAKGRRLRTPPGTGTRPMTERVREAIFNILDVDGADVLDLFAGSGSLGLEALSRRARSSVFVEDDRVMCGVIESNVAAVGLGGVVRSMDVGRFLATPALEGGRFDLVFVDPPYSMELASVEQVLRDLDPHLRGGGYVILHRPAGERPPAAPWPLDDDRTYGGTHLWWYRKEAP